MKRIPAVSVIMTAYNSSDFILESIQSILNQTFTDFELIVVDDGSTDNTWSLVKGLNDDRIRTFQKDNGGAAAGRNFAINHSRASLIAILDSDDLAYPDRLEKQVNFMNQNPDYVCVGSQARAVDIKGSFIYNIEVPLSHEEISSHFPHMPFVHPSIMFRKQPFLEAGGYPEYMLKAQDRVLMNRMSTYGCMANIAETLIDYRVVPGSNSSRSKADIIKFEAIISHAIEHNSINEDQKAFMHQRMKGRPYSIKLFEYHVFVGKKFLWNSFDSRASRKNFSKAIRIKPFILTTYALLFMTVLPSKWIKCLYMKLKRANP